MKTIWQQGTIWERRRPGRPSTVVVRYQWIPVEDGSGVRVPEPVLSIRPVSPYDREPNPVPSGPVVYRGIRFPGYNKPIPSNRPEKKYMVLAAKGGKVKLIHFGATGYGHNYSTVARDSYLARSAGIPGANDIFSANFWSREYLWAGPGKRMLRPPGGKGRY